MKTLKVAILMGSDSDMPIMKEASSALSELGIESVTKVLSAHRTPEETCAFSRAARAEGFGAIIAGAGGAAHLAGVIAAHTDLPVIGVPVPIEPLNGQDSLLSTVQMPRGMPVATVAIGNAWNAGLLAGHILSVADTPQGNEVREKLGQYREALRRKVLSKNT